jgi:hypothetical protein
MNVALLVMGLLFGVPFGLIIFRPILFMVFASTGEEK